MTEPGSDRDTMRGVSPSPTPSFGGSRTGSGSDSGTDICFDPRRGGGDNEVTSEITSDIGLGELSFGGGVGARGAVGV